MACTAASMEVMAGVSDDVELVTEAEDEEVTAGSDARYTKSIENQHYET